MSEIIQRQGGAVKRVFEKSIAALLEQRALAALFAIVVRSIIIALVVVRTMTVVAVRTTVLAVRRIDQLRGTY